MEKKFEIKEINSTVIIIPGKELSFYEVQPLKQKLINYFGKEKNLFIFDLTNTHWIDSFGMALIAWIVKNSILTNARVFIINPQSKVLQLFRETKLSEIVGFVKNIEEVKTFIKKQ